MPDSRYWAPSSKILCERADCLEGVAPPAPQPEWQRRMNGWVALGKSNDRTHLARIRELDPYDCHFVDCGLNLEIIEPIRRQVFLNVLIEK